MTRLIPLVVLFLVVVPLHAATITVDANGPADFSAIQPALDAATAGDVILVADGIYTGPGNRNLAFGGKNITLRSQNGPAACVINCQRQDRAFYIRSDEGPSCLIEGFTIINGTDYDGGAVYCYRASPTIRNCLLADNHASGGGGAIACRYGSPTIDGCIVRNNTANYGGGIQCQYDAEATIVACTIVDNRARYSGGGIDCDSDRPTRIVNCVIAENLTDRDGGAVSVGSDATPIITNCTIAANFAGNDGGGVFCEYR
ncbi:MAG: right-handed parallel beta-helix repeat-containing protein, partial [Planctomycetota bacterium]